MTYVVTGVCVNCKHTDCVAVCPVDCFYEGANTLVIHPDQCIDCFGAETEVVTSTGNYPFSGIRKGEVYHFLTEEGWKEGVVQEFGVKKLYAVTLKPVTQSDGRPNPRSRFTRMVRVTEDHLWFVKGEEKPVKGLRIGDLVMGCTATPNENEDYSKGVTHGLVFGDGSWNKQEKTSGLHLHYVQLYGEKAAAHKHRFKQLNWSPSCADHPGYVGTGVVRARRNLKTDLPEAASPSYIAGFVEGWLAADGSYYKDSKVLRSTNHDALEWVKDHLERAGYTLVGEGEEAHTETNFGPRTAKVRWLTLKEGPVYWRVMSVEEDEPEETFCVTMKSEPKAFTLAGGIYTHNCGVCVPECPIDAIVPDHDDRCTPEVLEANTRYSQANWPVITEKKDPMPGHETAKDVDDISLIDPNPGTGAT